MSNLIKCCKCGILEHINLIDMKPPAGADPESADFTEPHCVMCYGPGWCPAMSQEDIALSVVPKYAQLYQQWLLFNAVCEQLHASEDEVKALTKALEDADFVILNYPQVAVLTDDGSARFMKLRDEAIIRHMARQA